MQNNEKEIKKETNEKVMKDKTEKTLKGKKSIIIIICAAIMIGLIVVLGLYFHQKMSSDEYLGYQTNKWLKQHTNVEVELIEYTTVIDENGMKTNYGKYATTDINRKNNETRVVDHVDMLNNVGEMQEVTFEKAFGVEWRKTDAPIDFIKKIMLANGFDMDVNNAILNEEHLNETGLYEYYLQGDAAILDQMTEGVDEDKIVQKYCVMEMKKTNDGRLYPYSFRAIVQINENAQIVMKNVILKVNYYNLDM